MGWESSGVVRFDLQGPLLQVQTKIAKFKCAYNSLIIGPRGLQCGTIAYIKSLAGSDLTVGFSSRSNEHSQT